ncbi:MAG: MOSC domain-containing protein [Nanoarchaeota archaeon]|nr:MOSC domain-containing protein [Nanoarchaeota archaeon]MBU1321944.1 MOSC domain-containing protein [Nanoarchaeota archaeon]MBU1597940.1 MOSC domain-containing protein [Nanoarchaeota archaeon]MBU2441177.1 MOSC domain-containing protein [Nanoarchaeota archaeon]
MAKVLSINISEKKGTSKSPVKEAILKIDHGLVGDAHAASGIRQVSLLAKESHEKMGKHPAIKACLKNGLFGENITTKGIILHKLPIGTKLKIRGVVLEVSKIGKECHAPCEIMRKAGVCIMPIEGIFAIVKKEGKIKPGDKITVLQEKS